MAWGDRVAVYGRGGMALAVFVGFGSGLAVGFVGVEAVEVSTVGRFGATRRTLGISDVLVWFGRRSGGAVVVGVQQDEGRGDDLPDAPGVEADVA